MYCSLGMSNSAKVSSSRKKGILIWRHDLCTRHVCCTISPMHWNQNHEGGFRFIKAMNLRRWFQIAFLMTEWVLLPPISRSSQSNLQFLSHSQKMVFNEPELHFPSVQITYHLLRRKTLQEYLVKRWMQRAPFTNGVDWMDWFQKLGDFSFTKAGFLLFISFLWGL